MSQIKTLAIVQLVNSENIIGYIETSENEIIMEYPMTLMLDPMSGGLGMMPYLAIYTGTILNETIIDKKHIIGIIEEEIITKEIVEKYQDYKNEVLSQMQKTEPNVFDTADANDELK